MSQKYDPQKTTILAELRQKARLTQDEAAAYFGLKGKKRRDSVGNWERGRERPHHRHRTRFIAYLWHELSLRYDQERFQQIWEEVVVEEWQWLPLNSSELPWGQPASVQQAAESDAPFQALRDLPHFVGRSPEIEALEKILTSARHERIISLEGQAGTGKTALAAHMAHLLRSHFADGVLWAQLDASDTMSILGAFAGAYKLDVAECTTVESRSQLVRGLLANKQVLIILDNAEHSEQVRPLLPPVGLCAVLVTTRRHDLAITRTAHRFQIGPFAKGLGDALALCSKIMGKERIQKERSTLMELADLLGHLPLALDIAASRLANESHWTTEGFLDRLRKHQHRLGELQYEDLNVRASIALSHEALPPHLQQFFANLGAFDGEDFDAEASAYVADTPHEVADENLRQLCDFSLVQEGRSDRYRLHPLLRDYAREQIQTDEPFRRMAEHFHALLQKARELYEEGGESLERGLTLFDLGGENIRAGQAWAEAHAGELEAAAMLCDAFPRAAGFLLHLRLHPDERIQWSMAGLEAARNRNQSKAEGDHLRNLGLAYHDLGQLQKSVDYYEQSLTVFEALDDRASLSSVLDKLGLSYTRLDRFEQAIQFHERALRLAREIGDRQREGNALANLGVAHKNLRNFDRALRYQEQSLTIARKMGDRYGQCTSLSDLGSALLESGQIEQAIEYYEQSLQVSREIDYRPVEADALGNLGMAYAKLERPYRALAFYQQALNLDHNTGNIHGRAVTLNNMAEIYLNLDRLQKATSAGKEALAIARQHGYPLIEGDALFYLSQAQHRTGERSQAIANARKALRIFEALKDPAADEVQEKLQEW